MPTPRGMAAMRRASILALLAALVVARLALATRAVSVLVTVFMGPR